MDVCTTSKYSEISLLAYIKYCSRWRFLLKARNSKVCTHKRQRRFSLSRRDFSILTIQTLIDHSDVNSGDPDQAPFYGSDRLSV